MIRTSGKFTLAAFIAITTSPGPGDGEGMFSTTSDSGGPKALQRTALTGWECTTNVHREGTKATKITKRSSALRVLRVLRDDRRNLFPRRARRRLRARRGLRILLRRAAAPNHGRRRIAHQSV